jgi:hypothetical protein
LKLQSSLPIINKITYNCGIIKIFQIKMIAKLVNAG